MNRMNCPKCSSVLGIKPEYEGKKIKCPKCQTVMQVPIMSAVEATPAPKPPPVPPAVPKAEAIQERPAARRERLIDEDDDDRPRPKRRDDDEDDRPKRRRDEDDEDRPKRRRDRDENDDDDDRPRKRDRDRDEEDDWDEDRPKKKGNLRAQLKATGIACTLYYARFLTLGVGISVVAFAGGVSLIAILAQSLEMLQGVGFVAIFGMLCIAIVAPILGIIGGAFAIRCPEKTGARGLAIGALITDALLIFYVIFIIMTGGMATANPLMGLSRIAGGTVLIMMLLLVATWIAGFVLIMLMLRFFAMYVKDRGSTADALSLMIVYLAVSIGGFLLFLLLTFIFMRSAGGMGRPGAGGGLAFVIILQLIQIGWQVVLAILLFRIGTLCQTLRAQY
ncbi:MAG: zinc-ribbon domain-containing protein [Gemmataceae bacterium]|nr:zinc-ribbon domain-containing protein [Gemmataceae bacterium]MCI0740581.1 zinc-ribbon domain-containing protein [Gemmataceae bacterium]